MKHFVRRVINVLAVVGTIALVGLAWYMSNHGSNILEGTEESIDVSAKALTGTVARSMVQSLNEVAPVEIDVENIICRESIIDIAELAVVEEDSRDVYVYNKPNDRTRFLDVEIHGTNACYIFTYEGYVNAGIRDMEACNFHVDQEAELISVTVPEVEILHCDVDERSIEQVHYSEGVFADLDPEDMADMLAMCNEQLRSKVENSDILDRAHDNVESFMTRSVSDMISGTPLEGYRVQVIFLAPVTRPAAYGG